MQHSHFRCAEDSTATEHKGGGRLGDHSTRIRSAVDFRLHSHQCRGPQRGASGRATCVLAVPRLGTTCTGYGHAERILGRMTPRGPA
jgi:hypothetical protein